MTTGIMTETQCGCLPGRVCQPCTARGYAIGLAGYAARIYPQAVTRADELAEITATVAGCELRYRFSAAIGHVAGHGSREYGALISLANDLRRHPAGAAGHGEFHSANASREGIALRLASVRDLLTVLASVQHDAPRELTEALGAYATALDAETAA